MRTSQRFLTAAVTVLALTACGGGATPASDPTDTDAPTTTAPDAPAASTTDADDPTDPPTSAAEVEDVSQLLLAVPDLPDGWEETDVASEEEDGPNQASNICGAAEGDLDWTQQAEATGKVAFSGGQGLVLVQQVSRLGVDGATTALDEFAAAGDSCEQWTEDGVTFTVEPLTGLPELGDQMVALRATSEGQGMTFTIDMVGWRHGGIADGIAYFDFGGQGSREELVTILDAAEAKFPG